MDHPGQHPATVAAPGVLANDAGTALVATLLTPPTHGTVALGPTARSTTSRRTTSPAPTRSPTRPRRRACPAAATVTITSRRRRPTTTPGTIAPERHAPSPGPGRADQRRTAPASRVTAVGTPAHGTVVIDPDGGYRYTPPPGWGGTDTFTYDGDRQLRADRDRHRDVRVTTPVQLAHAFDDSADGVPGQPVDAHRADQRRARGQPGVRPCRPSACVDPVSGLPVTTVTGRRARAPGRSRRRRAVHARPRLPRRRAPGLPGHQHGRSDRVGPPDGHLPGAA